VLNGLRCRRLKLVERVVEFKFLPFEPAHLVKRQNIHSLHSPETGGEGRKPGDVFGIVGQSGTST
jgi:hypothetical protein